MVILADNDLFSVYKSSPRIVILVRDTCPFHQVCPAQAITIEAEEREDGSRRTTRSSSL